MTGKRLTAAQKRKLDQLGEMPAPKTAEPDPAGDGNAQAPPVPQAQALMVPVGTYLTALEVLAQTQSELLALYRPRPAGGPAPTEPPATGA